MEEQINLRYSVSNVKDDSFFLNEQFVRLTKDLEKFLQEKKLFFDVFDKNNSSSEKQLNFILENRDDFFSVLSQHFNESSKISEGFTLKEYLNHQHFYQKALGSFILEAEINKYIYQKPLGYSGDYVTMNYIYNYQENYFLGRSTFEKLINNFTCSIPISKSNIKRKDYLKLMIKDTLKEKKQPKITSIGCGPAREIVELIKENQMVNMPTFFCLDFEQKALNFISDQLRFLNNKEINIKLEKINILQILKDSLLFEKIKNQDLIYVFGVYDYFKETIAKRLTGILINLLNESGKLIVCNADDENKSLTSYYEMLGGWYLIYRKKSKILNWFNSRKTSLEMKFEDFYQFDMKYLILNITKQG
jgi:calcineurin-like phosphoesterase family protein